MVAALLAASLAFAATGSANADNPSHVQLTERGACADAVAVVRAGGTIVAPELRLYEGWMAADFEHGTAIVRDLAQRHEAPDVLRLSDEEETRVSLELAVFRRSNARQ